MEHWECAAGGGYIIQTPLCSSVFSFCFDFGFGFYFVSLLFILKV